MRRFLRVSLVALMALVVGGAIYEWRGRQDDRARYPQVGRSVDIGGRSLNLHCAGTGTPTVVLEAAVGYRWLPIQHQVSTFTRVCWYDRAGHGWSEPGPRPRTSVAVADDLHALLRAAGIVPPYVLVGASGAGFPVRVFAARHMDEIAGVVLVDAAHEDQFGREPRSSLGFANRLPGAVRSALYVLAPAAGEVGVFRLMLHSTRANIARRPPPQGMTREEAQYLYFISSFPTARVTEADEARNWLVSADAARRAGSLGDRPLIVLTAGKVDVPPNPADAAEVEAFRRVWITELQPKLARLSTRGKQVIVEHSRHGIQFEAPDVLVGAIKELVVQSRATASISSNVQTPFTTRSVLPAKVGG
jgi:pimeloyl-ACP methyl ester carboxylesterase